MGGDLEFVAFDIETTGLDADAVVTVVGFDLRLGVRVFCQTGGRAGGDVEAVVRDRCDAHVVVSVHDSEAVLLEAVDEFVAARLRDEDYLLVAYNGETWQTGFDLPFLRSRFAAHGLEWAFRGLPYADMMPVVTKRFNTTVDGDKQRDLDGVYEVLCDGDIDVSDPFDDSEAAVTAFENGEFAEVVMHNVADVLRTGVLGRLAQRYCSKSDFDLKSLTPAIHDE